MVKGLRPRDIRYPSKTEFPAKKNCTPINPATITTSSTTSFFMYSTIFNYFPSLSFLPSKQYTIYTKPSFFTSETNPLLFFSFLLSFSSISTTPKVEGVAAALALGSSSPRWPAIQRWWCDGCGGGGCATVAMAFCLLLF